MLLGVCQTTERLSVSAEAVRASREVAEKLRAILALEKAAGAKEKR
jgi:hypothetical protein